MDRFKGKAKDIDKKMSEAEYREKEEYRDRSRYKKKTKKQFIEDDWDDFDDDFDNTDIQPAQKSESFHHYILESKHQDLEKSIRGYKDVFDQEKQKWTTVRKKIHCFTHEESEDILRTAQSHLATDIKLSRIRKDQFGEYMMILYNELSFLFESIAEYRYGRYGDNEKQYQMKLQNHKIFLELMTRIQANYSRAIDGHENKVTHQSVKGQESLQNTDSNRYDMRGYD